jgi:hypothetical protein
VRPSPGALPLTLQTRVLPLVPAHLVLSECTRTFREVRRGSPVVSSSPGRRCSGPRVDPSRKIGRSVTYWDRQGFDVKSARRGKKWLEHCEGPQRSSGNIKRPALDEGKRVGRKTQQSQRLESGFDSVAPQFPVSLAPRARRCPRAGGGKGGGGGGRERVA